MKKLFVLSVALLSLTACDTLEEFEASTTDVISFESRLYDFNGNTAMPGHTAVNGFIGTNEYDGIFWGKPYAADAKINVYDDVMSDYKMFHGLLFHEGIAHFGSYYDDGMQWGTGVPIDTWNGFVVSQICDRGATSVDYANQFSAWAAAGANGTKTFVVGYCPDTDYIDTAATPYMVPTIEFSTTCDVKSLWVANSTVSYPYVPNGDDPSLTLLISAYNGKTQVGEKQVEMAGKWGKLSDWTKVECAFGGKVDKLVFTMLSGDELYPTYFCLDEITVVF